MRGLLSYSKWKAINLRTKRKRLRLKFLKYREKHPRYSDYCFKKYRKGKCSLVDACLNYLYTDVMFQDALIRGEPFMDSIPKEQLIGGAYIHVPMPAD